MHKKGELSAFVIPLMSPTTHSIQPPADADYTSLQIQEILLYTVETYSIIRQRQQRGLNTSINRILNVKAMVAASTLTTASNGIPFLSVVTSYKTYK